MQWEEEAKNGGIITYCFGYIRFRVRLFSQNVHIYKNFTRSASKANLFLIT